MPMDTIELEVEILAISNQSILIADGDTEAWLLKKLIPESETFRVGDEVVITIPVWHAKDRGVI